MKLIDYIKSINREKTKQKAKELKAEKAKYLEMARNSVADNTVFNGMTDDEISDTFRTFMKLMEKLSRAPRGRAGMSAEEMRTINKLQEETIKLLMESPKLMQIELDFDSAYEHAGINFTTLFALLCFQYYDDVVFYMADKIGKSLVNCDEQNIAMIAIDMDREDIALDLLREGIVDPLHQDEYGDNLGMYAITHSIADLLEVCVAIPEMCKQINEDGDNMLIKQAIFLADGESEKYYSCFKTMLANSELRKYKHEGYDVWRILDENCYFDKSILGDFLNLRELDKLEERENI